MRALLFLGLVSFGGCAAAIPFGGVEFPDGLTSFADEVVSFSPGSDVAGPYLDSSHVIGAPDFTGPDGLNSDGALSLGDGGSLVVRFVDNSLTTSGDAGEDLWIFEVGAAVEEFNVAISMDNINWIDLGALSGQPTGIDIDSVAGVVAGAQYSYVRLTDNASRNQTNGPFGEADIDAIGAISSAPPVQQVPAPPAPLLLIAGIPGILLGLRRTMR